MASNTFGKLFKITTWGESHGKAMGVVIDGCPAGVTLNEQLINEELAWRAPGRNAYLSPRKESDQAEILSGIWEGKTTGAPISIIIWNRDVKSHHYDPIQQVLRPGHANYTYLQKYGCFDYRGGGRASARETACRVAAGAIAKQILSDVNVSIVAYVKVVGNIEVSLTLSDAIKRKNHLQHQVRSSSVFCPDPLSTKQIESILLQMQREQDSIGGVVEAIAFNVPVGWGDPVYEKLEANLAKAMLSLPASKGFEIGCGFSTANMKGSEHNDLFYSEEEIIRLASNQAGGTLGGISNGMPITIRVPFKPASSIRKPQPTVNIQGEPQTLELPQGSRHDVCVAIRAVPVIEAMFALVLVDAMLMHRSSKI